MSNSNSN